MFNFAYFLQTRLPHMLDFSDTQNVSDALGASVVLVLLGLLRIPDFPASLIEAQLGRQWG